MGSQMPETFSHYRLVLHSHLGNLLSSSIPFVEFATTFGENDAPMTEMELRVADQSELIGLLNDLHGRGLHILSLTQVVERNA